MRHPKTLDALASNLLVAIVALWPVFSSARPREPDGSGSQSASSLAEPSGVSTGSAFIVSWHVDRNLAGKWHLAMSILNATTQPVTMHRDCVPWEIPDTGLFHAYELRKGEELRREWTMRNPGTATNRIEPGETYEGESDLTALFPDLEKALRRDDVVIFWSYRFRTIQPFERVETHAGVCFLSRSGREEPKN